MPEYGFDMWTHSLHGTALRYLKGRVKGNQSVLMLTNCSYQDAGDYECIARREILFYRQNYQFIC